MTELVAYRPTYRDAVLRLAREMHAESVIHRYMPLNEEKVIAQLEAAAANPDCYFRLAVCQGEIVGGFLAVPSTLYFCDDKVSQDRAWFVRRDGRGTGAAVALVRDWIRWGKERGVRWFFLGQSTAVNMETTAALYERLGFTVVGVNTVMGV